MMKHWEAERGGWKQDSHLKEAGVAHVEPWRGGLRGFRAESLQEGTWAEPRGHEASLHREARGRGRSEQIAVLHLFPTSVQIWFWASAQQLGEKLDRLRPQGTVWIFSKSTDSLGVFRHRVTSPRSVRMLCFQMFPPGLPAAGENNRQAGWHDEKSWSLDFRKTDSDRS